MLKSTLAAAFVLVTVTVAACGGGTPSPHTPDNGNGAADAAAPSSTGTGTGTATTDGTGTPPSTDDAGTTPPPSGGGFAAQAQAGKQLYGDNCSVCHGDNGEGDTAPMLVGLDKGALPLAPPKDARDRTTQFKTAQDVYDFAIKTMPPKKIGSIKADDMWAILAWDLSANGMDLKDQKLDATSASGAVLHK